MLTKDSLECCRETPEDHLCNEPCWKSAGSQEIASLRCRMHPGSRTGETEPYLCRQRSSCPCPEGKERKVVDSLQEEQELSLVEGLWDVGQGALEISGNAVWLFFGQWLSW